MKKYFYLFLSSLIVSITFTFAQKVEWVVYGGDSLESNVTRRILIDHQYNCYLFGRTGQGWPLDSFMLKGNINPHVTGSFFIKIDSLGNYIKHINLPYPFRFDDDSHAEMNDSDLIYIANSNTYTMRLMIMDTSFSLLFDIQNSFGSGGFIDCFHLTKNSTAYIKGRYYYSFGPWRDAVFKILPNHQTDLLCIDSVYCTDVYTGDDPVGNYYYDKQIHKSGGGIINLPNPISDLSEFNFNDDGISVCMALYGVQVFAQYQTILFSMNVLFPK